MPVAIYPYIVNCHLYSALPFLWIWKDDFSLIWLLMLELAWEMSAFSTFHPSVWFQMFWEKDSRWDMLLLWQLMCCYLERLLRLRQFCGSPFSIVLLFVVPGVIYINHSCGTLFTWAPSNRFLPQWDSSGYVKDWYNYSFDGVCQQQDFFCTLIRLTYRHFGLYHCWCQRHSGTKADHEYFERVIWDKMSKAGAITWRNPVTGLER